MDRYLLSGAMLLLTLECSWLLNDLKIIDVPFFNQAEISVDSKPIGRVLTTTQNLRRRGSNSILWEDSKPDDTLYMHDSVLTLEKSAATLQLQEQSQIFLSENTLIVLEPADKKAPDQLKVRFSHGGLHSRNVASNTLITAPSWTMEVEKGAEIKLRSMPGEKLEVELLKGKVNVQGAGETRSFDNEQVILLNKEGLQSVPISEKLGWDSGRDGTFRVYGHTFPQSIWLSWKGQATKLRIMSGDRIVSDLKLNPEANKIQLDLANGNYEARLSNENEVSATLSVQVWEAPSLHALLPHPRDRFPTDQEALFTWITAATIPGFQIEFSRDPLFSQVVVSHNSSLSQTTLKMPEQGFYYWRVQGVDELGFVIPSLEANPVFSVKNPLSAPVLKPPETRAPAKADSSYNWQRVLDELFSLFISRAEAKEERFEAVFHWEQVEGAAYYNIEIDTKPDFQNPVVVEKITEAQFVWTKAAEGVFYWRVAAGAEDRMGLFSEAARIELAKPSKPTQNVAPGVQVRKVKAKQEPLPKAPIVPYLEPTPPPPVIAGPPEPARPGHYDVWYGAGFDYSLLTGADDTTAVLSGGSPLRLGASLEVPAGEFASVLFDATYEQGSWKPKSQKEYPFQTQVLDSTARAHLHYRSSPGAIHFGLAGASVTSLHRTNLESVELRPVSLVGPSFGFEWTRYEYWMFQHFIGLEFGAGLTEFATEHRFVRHIRLTDRASLLLGAQMNLVFDRHTSGSNYRFQIGVSTGLEW